MCTYLVMIVPDTADLDRAIALVDAAGFTASTDLPRQLPQAVAGMRLLDPRKHCCDCRTRIGCEHRTPLDADELRRRSRQGVRARWSTVKRARWIEQQLRCAHRLPSAISDDAEPELGMWASAAQAAASSPAVGRIGVVLQDFDTEVTEWLPAVAIEPTAAALRGVARLTPTWLVPSR